MRNIEIESDLRYHRKKAITMFMAIFVALSLVFVGASARAMTYYVHGDNGDDGLDCKTWTAACKTIQGAVSKASDGDEIWVKKGTYELTSTINNGPCAGISFYGGFNGTETERSQRNWVANPTIVDGTSTEQCFSICVGDVGGTIDGFTIQNGFASYYGGGIYIDGSDYPQTPYSIANCTFSGNSGGALSIYQSTATITNCNFTGNSSDRYAGAIYIIQPQYPLTTDIANCTFTGNSGGEGGGIYILGAGLSQGMINITGSTFSGNNANFGTGGGISANSAYATIANCKFTNNTASAGETFGYGGAIYSDSSSLTITDSVFGGNSAVEGGAIYVRNSTDVHTINNCTFFANGAAYEGHAILELGNPTYSTRVHNSIFWGDEGLGCQIKVYGALSIDYSDVQLGEEGGICVGEGGSRTLGDHNLSGDPLFVNSAAGDFHLQAGSPCIDTGFNTVPGGIGTVDLGGYPRIFPLDGTVDMGAYEFKLLIDPTVWADLEVVKRINNGVLESQIRRKGSNGNNYLMFYNSGSVNSFSADVTVKAYENNGSFPHANLLGFVYNDDATLGGGHTGDVLGVVGIGHNGTELEGFWSISKCTGPNCNLPNEIQPICSGRLGPAALNLNTPYTTSFSWNDSTSTFTFRVGSTSIDVNNSFPSQCSGRLPDKVRGPNLASKGIGTRVTNITTASAEGGFISATFDNVKVDGSETFYDTFDFPPIDRSRWLGTLELVNMVGSVVDNGKLVQELTQRGVNGGYNMNFVNSQAISGFEADLKVVKFQYDPALPVRPQGRLYAALYNDGTGNTTPGDVKGDVSGTVGILDNGQGLGPQAFYAVSRCLATACNLPGEYEILYSGIFKNVALDEFHKFSLSWDGFNVALGCDGNVIFYNPTSVRPIVLGNGLPKGRKGIGTRVSEISNTNEWAYVSAAFDNVVITQPTELQVSTATGNYCGTTDDPLSATLTSGGAPLSGKTVTFTLNGTSVGSAVTDINGVAPLPGIYLLGTINANNYPTGVGASFAGDGTYSASSRTASLTVNKANASVSVNGYTAAYDCNAHGATGTATGVCTPAEPLSGLNLGATFTNVPGGTAHWTFTGGINYNDKSGDVGIVINKTNANISVTPYNVIYDCKEHTASYTATGVCTPAELLSGLDLSGTKHTDAGHYNNDPWTFTDVTGNYNNASGVVNDTINPAIPTVTVTGGGPFIYDCQSHPAIATASGCSGTVTGTFSFTYTPEGPVPPKNALSNPYAVLANFTSGDTNYTDATGNGSITINKATPDIHWADPADITYPTALGDAQLNATASGCDPSLTGTFTYDPASCTVLGPPPISGSPLSVNFYPAVDYQRNYTNASATVHINVLVPMVSAVKVGGLWICTQSDASGYPVAMYVCPTDNCSICMTDPTTTPYRCEDSSVFDVGFLPTQLKWAGPGSGGTVDFVTSQTLNSQTWTIVYRCVEGIDLCFTCGYPDKIWTCDPEIRQSLLIPAFSTSSREKIEDVWVCAGLPDQSGCFTSVYSCSNATDQNPCPCGNDPSNQIYWSPSTVLDVEFAQGELKWSGPSGSDSSSCETVYFVTSACIYKCSSDTGHCFSYCP